MLKQLDQEYQLCSIIGEGYNSTVHKATHKDFGVVAIKNVHRAVGIRGMPESIGLRMDREIESLQTLSNRHDNIISILDVIVDQDQALIVMEYMSSSLTQLINQDPAVVTERRLPWMKQLASALQFCHSHDFLHRDIKPANILVSSNYSTVKLADFGLARRRAHTMSPTVTTRFYRAPEVLFGSQTYTEKIDIWSLGLVFVEMFSMVPMFPGDTDIDQLCKIFDLTGTPNAINWPAAEHLPDFKKISFEYRPKMQLLSKYPEIPTELAVVLETMLQLDADRRPSAKKLTELLRNINI